jgi:ribosomal protein S7
MYFEDYVKLDYYGKVFYLLERHFIGKFIKKGKKLYAWKLYNSLKLLLKKKTKLNPNLVLLVSVLNSLIKVHFIKKRFGGTRKDIPIPLKLERQIRLTITDIISYANTKRMKSINIKRLARVLCYSYKFKGPVIKLNYLKYQKAKENRVLLSFIKK